MKTKEQAVNIFQNIRNPRSEFLSTYCRRKHYFNFSGGHFLINLWDSRHVQLKTYLVFDEGFDVQVKHKQKLEPEGQI